MCYHDNISMCCWFPVQCLPRRTLGEHKNLHLLFAGARFRSWRSPSSTLSLDVLPFSEKSFICSRPVRASTICRCALPFSEKSFICSRPWRASSVGGNLLLLSAWAQTGGGVPCMPRRDDGKPPALGERLCGGPFPWGRGLWGCGMRAGVPRGACLSLQECLHLLCRLLPGGYGAHHQACARG